MPSTSRVPLLPRECHGDPFFQSETIISSKKYCFVISPLVSASQTFSGALWIKISYRCVSAILTSSRDVKFDGVASRSPQVRRSRLERRRVVLEPLLQGPGRSTRDSLHGVGDGGGMTLPGVGVELDQCVGLPLALPSGA